MQLFSQRKGVSPQKVIIQIQSMDDSLRASLWNTFSQTYKNRPGSRLYGTREYSNNSDTLYRAIWIEHFRRPYDEFTSLLILNEIQQFFLKAEWYKVYDLLEFIVSNFDDASLNQDFIEECNRVLKRELAVVLVKNQLTGCLRY